MSVCRKRADSKMAANFTEFWITLLLIGDVESFFLYIMLLGPSNPFLFTIRIHFNTISKLGTNIHVLHRGYIRTRIRSVSYHSAAHRGPCTRLRRLAAR